MRGELIRALVWVVVVLSAVGEMAIADTCEVPTEWRVTRPDPPGQPTPVSVANFVIDLLSINDSQQSYQADFFLFVTWKDPRLVAGKEIDSLAGCSLPLDELWTPRLVFINERSVRRVFPERATVKPDGTVEYVQRLQGEFGTRLHLQDFPFDEHELKLEIVSRGYTAEDVAFLPTSQATPVYELTITDWTLSAGEAEVVGRYVPVRDWTLAGLVFKVQVQRRLGFYTLKTFLPLTLIVVMSWAVFWIKPGLLPPQIGVSTSAILTLIAFQFSLGYLLPRLSYLTRADRFLIGSTLLVFLAFGEAIRTSYLANRDQEQKALKIDRISRVLFPVLFLFVLIVSFVV